MHSLDGSKMKIAAFQFAGGADVHENLRMLEEGIAQAGAAGVRLLLTQECALTGYPPLETPSVKGIDFAAAERATARVRELARLHDLYVALGTIVPVGSGFRNSLLLIAPDGSIAGAYAKRALWGWDRDNFVPGDTDGIFSVDGVKVGLRICFEIRFPEYFRQLFAAGVQIACVAFCDTAEAPNPARYALIRGHLATRAVENVFTVVSANSSSRHVTAPTAIVDSEGKELAVAPPHGTALLTVDWHPTDASTFGRRGRIEHSRALMGLTEQSAIEGRR
jgi:predicted amidohydrolase